MIEHHHQNCDGTQSIDLVNALWHLLWSRWLHELPSLSTTDERHYASFPAFRASWTEEPGTAISFCQNASTTTRQR
jgi:hypothetical protein